MKYAAFLTFSLLGSCAGTIEAPSLEPRAAESADIDAPAPSVTSPLPADAAQAAFIAKMIALARKGDAEFNKALLVTQTRAAAQSEAWIAAQNARSAAESLRGETLDALTGLDGAIRASIDKGIDAAALVAARTEIQTLYDRQAARLAALTD